MSDPQPLFHRVRKFNSYVQYLTPLSSHMKLYILLTVLQTLLIAP